MSSLLRKLTMTLGRLVPYQVCERDLDCSCETFIARIRGMVRAESLIFTSYWKHKGEFIGRVQADRFRIMRFIRDAYLPVVYGRVTERSGGCRLVVRFVSVQGFALALGFLLLPVIASRYFGLRAWVLLAPIAIIHLVGCIHFGREIDVFLVAAKLERAHAGGSESEARVWRRIARP